ncbi:3-keto-disaccharide hydrolase [Alienimonas californiensis]|uniref:3-keto-alpha-glucoside-1,2-lyase/3-keto-2-hydroxy-glucal hydratase domain-containing protein n=1 Tax=Alienimonas californiensis TaxID=2527989 RepID=A0A517P7U4_9PLAN|nr:DUF1080 domain-containing protein [Alienimonas californiensis]QDT15454.1 hypothetical protein CA12_15390 [Alienimonas californiensis]
MCPPFRLFAPLSAAFALLAVACVGGTPQEDPAPGSNPEVGGDVAPLFDGKTLNGWTGEKKLWSVKMIDDVPTIVGVSEGLDHNTFLTADRTLGDFDLTFEMQLTPNEANSGIQFRSVRIAEEGEKPGPDSEMRGYQADAGAGWWGKLYEENGRGMLYPAKDQPNQKSAEDALKPGAWNVYRISAEGDRVRTWINGAPSVDLVDPQGRKEGLIGLQMHSGGPMTVRFRRFVLQTP